MGQDQNKPPYAWNLREIAFFEHQWDGSVKNMKSTKKKRNQDVQLRFDCLAAGLLHVLHALRGENLLKNLNLRLFCI
ncbi:MAG: hypothetical protein WC708_13175 [Lentisphaeria bacterium]